jgi:predicted NBD/HSP70 family sugar kinase
LTPAAQACLIGQPVALGRDPSPAAALRISASARLVSEAWSADAETAHRNLQRAIDQAATAIANLESLLVDLDGLKPMDASHGR